MRVLLLADSNSPHTIRWIKALINKGYIVRLFTFQTPDVQLHSDTNGLIIDSLNLPRQNQFRKETNLYKLIYLRSVLRIKKIINEFKPDILHSHYASSYGLIGALTGFHPFIISVWGSDIYNFPNHSMIHRALMKFNLSRADMILSTSQVMKKETQKYTDKEITVTPFGIDIEKFIPALRSNRLFKTDDLVIGTIKTLEKKYGIEYLIRAFAIVKQKFSELNLKLLIIGGGSEEATLKRLAKDIGFNSEIVFTGKINYKNIPEYHNMIDIYCALSIEDSESFGVAVLEASACGKPVIVSKVGGLQEIVVNGETGFIVTSRDHYEAAKAIEKLILNPNLRNQLGDNGRYRVSKYYNWKDSVLQMINLYENFIH